MTERVYERVESLDNFFTKYKEILPAHFAELFGENVEETEVKALDNLLIDVFGDRILIKNYFEQLGKDTMVERAVRLCDMVHFQSWKATKAFITKALESDIEYPIKAVNQRTTEREGENTDTTQNKENAFDNQQTASNTDSSESNGTHNETISVNEIKKRGNQKTVFSNAGEAIEFTKHNDYLKIILTDIAEYISLAIF